jgi:large exoprotein involved in heme utilization and adhesion
LSGNPSSIGTFASGNTTGDGGNISIVADTLTLTDGGLINAQAINNGKGGTIQVDVNRLQLSEGAQLLTTASGTGVAGNIAVNATEQIAITGRNPMFLVRQQNSTQFSQGRLITPSSGIFASTDVGSTASGGMITVNTGHLLVQDSGQVTVESRGTGAAGEISINARFIQLQDQGRISAETTSSTGGNINLNVQDILLLRRNSLISATAGTAASGGDGGNIRINAGFVVAHPLENSDITANAFSGRGGRVDINTLGIFGFTPRSRQDLERALGTTDPIRLNPQRLSTSDITAISQTSPSLSGNVAINTPNLDPTQSLTQLPEVPVDASRLIDQQLCAVSQGSQFVITGRGGLPDSPTAMLNPAAGWEDWRTTERKGQEGRSPQSTSPIPQPQAHSSERLIEAQGWLQAEDGSIWLTATPTTVTSTLPWTTSSNLINCRNSSDRY